MKNLVKFVGIIALVAVIGFSMAACDNGTGGGGGGRDVLDGTTWRAEIIGVGYAITTFNSPNFTSIMYMAGVELSRNTGTYSVSGNTITFRDSSGTGTGTLSGNTFTQTAMGTTLTYTKQ